MTILRSFRYPLAGFTAGLCLIGAAQTQAQSSTATLPDEATAFQWRSTAQVITPRPEDGNGFSALKDPSIVWAEGRYHLFMTSVGADGWGLAYASFTDWSEAPTAKIVNLLESGIGPGYRAAPQVFFFEPQGLWYMIYQSGPPMYSTTRDIADPMSWSAPRPLFEETPEIIRTTTGQEAWLDFWVICDEGDCYLFNTDDHGNLFRSRTALDRFPEGFSDTRIVMSGTRDDLFEAGMHYRIAGGGYLTVVEAIGPQGRYFRSWTSDRLDGEWRPQADTLTDPFAGSPNVTFDGPAWSLGISHGELVRQSHDQTLTIDPCQPLRFLYQGLEAHASDTDYIDLPYRLGLLTATGPNPISAQCRTAP